jgi:cation:H+ antiporter
MISSILAGVAGIVLLYTGGELLVRSSSILGKRMGFSDLLVGLTIVAFGTSAPELVSSIIAILKGSPGLVIGNVLGSNMANLGLILALTAIIRPFETEFRKNWKDFVFLVVSSLGAGLMMMRGHITAPEGLMLVIIFILYMFYLIRNKRSLVESEIEIEGAPNGKVSWAIAGLILGMILLPLGADRLVYSALEVAFTFGVPEHVMGLTMVALGTSLPELVTSLIATFKRKGDISLGNIIGSNIFNILLVPGVCSLSGRLSYSASGIGIDVMAMLTVSFAVVFFAAVGLQMTRSQGAFLLLGYLGYIIHLVR